jgi:cyclopropane fatty-acyl-phospholipid synthase-like methyltransferase
MTRRHSEAFARNHQPIIHVMESILQPGDVVWEIGCGTGQHSVVFAQHFPDCTFCPSDRAGTLDSAIAWAADANLPNLRRPVSFDLFHKEPAVAGADVIVSINVLHIAPVDACRRLFEHAASLAPGGRVVTYGPWRYNDRPLEPSNEQFDEFLREQDPTMGLRVAQDVDAIAASLGWHLCNDIAMPANNRMRWWTRA